MRPPDMKGETGRAWRVRDVEVSEGPPDWKACIALWLVEAPGRHPLWSWWSMTVIHLRPIPGARPAHIRREGATHEFMWAALDPDRSPPLAQIEGKLEPLPWLTPFDLVHQVVGISDQQAASILAACVRGIVYHRASPDSDLRSWWERSLDETVAHHLAGGHPHG